MNTVTQNAESDITYPGGEDQRVRDAWDRKMATSTGRYW